MTLQEWQQHFNQLFGRRNGAFASGLPDRFGHLFLASKCLSDAVRGKSTRPTGACLADVFGWTMAIANLFPVPLVEAFAFKWCRRVCAYCGAVPCKCAEDRPSIVEPFKREQVVCPSSSLQALQDDLAALYGDINHQAGARICLLRLNDEIAEAYASFFAIGFDPSHLTVTATENMRALELADIVAWCMTVASVLGFYLEGVLLSRYGKTCPQCSKLPCDCGHLVISGGEFCPNSKANSVS